jgi:hypothetical protein
LILRNFRLVVITFKAFQERLCLIVNALFFRVIRGKRIFIIIDSRARSINRLFGTALIDVRIKASLKYLELFLSILNIT